LRSITPTMRVRTTTGVDSTNTSSVPCSMLVFCRSRDLHQCRPRVCPSGKPQQSPGERIEYVRCYGAGPHVGRLQRESIYRRRPRRLRPADRHDTDRPPARPRFFSRGIREFQGGWKYGAGTPVSQLEPDLAAEQPGRAGVGSASKRLMASSCRRRSSPGSMSMPTTQCRRAPRRGSGRAELHVSAGTAGTRLGHHRPRRLRPAAERTSAVRAVRDYAGQRKLRELRRHGRSSKGVLAERTAEAFARRSELPDDGDTRPRSCLHRRSPPGPHCSSARAIPPL
jgi:hypothetical protein